jgi:signal transduction histidine kinase
MLSKLLDPIRKNTGLRLAVSYTLFFSLSFLILFAMSYLFLSMPLKKKDREMLRFGFDKYAALYGAGGLVSLQREVSANRYDRKPEAFLVRVAGPDNTTRFLHVPEEAAEAAGKSFDRLKPVEGLERIKVRRGKDDDYSVELMAGRLSDGCWLQVGKGVEEREELLERFRETFWGFVIPVVLIGAVGGWVLAFRALKPIRHLISTVRSIEKGEMNTRVPPTSTGGELDDLVVLFNGMLEKVERLIKGMRSTLDNVAHDLRTPMTRMKGAAEAALKSEPKLDLVLEALANCSEQSEQVLTMLDTLMDVSEAESGVMNLSREHFKVHRLVESVVELYELVSEERGIAIHVTVPGELSLFADWSRMRQVLANLLDNALKYTQSGGTVHIVARLEGDRVLIAVEDTGAGIAAHEFSRIWERLYRCDKSRSGRGLGLGLSLVRAIVTAHGGTVELTSEIGQGSRFILRLPAPERA